MQERRGYEVRVKAIRIYEERGEFCRALEAVGRGRRACFSAEPL